MNVTDLTGWLAAALTFGTFACRDMARLRVLTTCGAARSPFFPLVATCREQGLPRLTQREWFGAFLPVRTPAALVQALAEALRAVAQEQEVREAWERTGLIVECNTPAQLLAALRSEHEFWGPLIKSSGFTPDATTGAFPDGPGKPIVSTNAHRPPCGMNTITTTLPNAMPLAARQAAYLTVLTWLFTLFNSVRLLSYLPTLWMIQKSGDSSQHSLWTWCTWLGANLTMAAWLYEQNGQRLGRAVVVSLGNAAMCTATVAVIAAHRAWAF